MTEQLDGWETESASSYSIEKIYSSWGLGDKTSVTVTVKIPQVFKRKLDEMVASGKTGYKTFSDGMRDCLYHRVHWWSLNPEMVELKLGDPLSFIRRFSARAYRKAVMIDFDETLQEEIQSIRDLRSRGLGKLAHDELMETYKDAQSVDEPYRSYFCQQLETEFGITPNDLIDI